VASEIQEHRRRNDICGVAVHIEPLVFQAHAEHFDVRLHADAVGKVSAAVTPRCDYGRRRRGIEQVIEVLGKGRIELPARDPHLPVELHHRQRQKTDGIGGPRAAVGVRGVERFIAKSAGAAAAEIDLVWVEAASIYRRAESAGIGERPLKRATRLLGVMKEPKGFRGNWHWALPPESSSPATLCTPSNLSDSVRL